MATAMMVDTTETPWDAVLRRQQRAHLADPLPDATSRIMALRRLERVVRDHQAGIADAVAEDFGSRARPETLLAEVLPVLEACRHARRHLAGWMRPRRRGVGLSFRPASNRVEYHPVGIVGIVAPWNYPVFLTLGPLVDVLAAGNRAMIKVSEFTPATGARLREILAEAFDTGQVAVIEGDKAVAQAFCALAFDHLIYTGSTGVGREVMRAAAANLTPVTLELGGKSPVILADDYEVAKAARSVAVGKFFNAGQTCTAPDYVLAPRAKAEGFARAVLATAEAMYPRLAGNADCTAIISDRHHARLGELVAEAEAAGAIVLRHRDTAPDNARRFPPTVLLHVPPECRVMREEIFGPVLPVLPYGSLDEAIGFVNERPRPLALYIYSRDRGLEREVLTRTMSGGVTVNGTLVQAAQVDMPFGGTGPSGIGAYHGHEGFLRFSHARAVHRPGGFSGIEFLRPPYGMRARLMLRALLPKGK